MKINHIAIIGGGSAGWLAANYLGEALSDSKEKSITLIESPDVPIIGVGEGTVPAMRHGRKACLPPPPFSIPRLTSSDINTLKIEYNHSCCPLKSCHSGRFSHSFFASILILA